MSQDTDEVWDGERTKQPNAFGAQSRGPADERFEDALGGFELGEQLEPVTTQRQTQPTERFAEPESSWELEVEELEILPDPDRPAPQPAPAAPRRRNPRSGKARTTKARPGRKTAAAQRRGRRRRAPQRPAGFWARLLSALRRCFSA